MTISATLGRLALLKLNQSCNLHGDVNKRLNLGNLASAIRSSAFIFDLMEP
jgi:hypothetical protein